MKLRAVFRRRSSIVAATTALAFASAAAFGQTRVVTSGADDSQTAPPGSLREALQSAQAGDVITFGKNAQTIVLKRPLQIPEEAKGLVIQGRVQLRPDKGALASLLIFADDVKIDVVVFQSVDVNVEANVSGVRILGCAFSGTAVIDIETTKNTTIGSVAEPNTFSGPDRPAISVVNDVGTSIVGNHFTQKGFAVDGSGSDTLLIDQNTTKDGGIHLVPFSATITNNKLTVKTGSAVIVGSVGATSSLPDPVLIDTNTIHVNGFSDGIDTERVNVTISNNTIVGKGHGNGILAACGGAENFSAGPVVLTANTVKGFFTGISFVCGPTQSPTVTMSQDDALANKDFGFSVDVGPLAKVTMDDEFATGNGKGKTGGGSKFDVDGDGVVVKNSKFESNNGVGVEASSRGGTLTFDVDEIRKNKQDGVHVSQGAGHVSFGDCDIDLNKSNGAHFVSGAKGEVVGSDLQGNTKSGVFADTGSLVKVSVTTFQGNGGPGIDLADAAGKNAVTPNTIDKTSNANIGWPGTGTKNDEPPVYDAATGQLKGKAAPASVVEAFTIEAGKRKGDPKNGEGAAYLGSVVAAADGSWAWPATGRIECPDAQKLTFTATSNDPVDPVTSEFSRDIVCPPPPAGWGGVTISSTDVHIGDVANFSPKSAPVTFTNNSAAPVSFTIARAANSAGGDVYIQDGVPETVVGPHTLAPGESLTITINAVYYAGSGGSLGHHTATIAISGAGRPNCVIKVDYTAI